MTKHLHSRMRPLSTLSAALLMLFASAAHSFELRTEAVTDSVYALVGEIGGRTADNHALNNTLGFVVTGDGVLLVSSGADAYGAKLIEQAVAKVTAQPIRWVINVGAQDHHWLGNDYFAHHRAEIIALQRTVDGQHKHAADHLQRLRSVLGPDAELPSPYYAPKPFPLDRAALRLGGVDVELIWPGNGHFPGDAVLWLPQQRVLFSGDFVFNDRMLGIHPFTPVQEWQLAFHRIAAMQPLYLVPGHGHPGDLAKAQRDTGDYLDWLVNGVSDALADWQGLEDTVDAMGDAPQFRRLKFYEGWHRRNINRAYLQLEAAL